MLAHLFHVLKLFIAVGFKQWSWHFSHSTPSNVDVTLTETQQTIQCEIEVNVNGAFTFFWSGPQTFHCSETKLSCWCETSPGSGLK